VPVALVPTSEDTSAKRRLFEGLPSDAEQASHVMVSGELDIATVPQLDAALRSAHAESALVVVDLRASELVDASGAHLLLAADRRIRDAGGRLIVVRGSPEIEWFFALIGLDRELEVVDWPPAVACPPGSASA